MVAVGTSVARCPPHRSVRERLTHTAPASDDGGCARPTKASAPHAVQRLGHGLSASVCGPWRAPRRSPRPRPFPPDPPQAVARPGSVPSLVLRPGPTPRRRTRGACGWRLPPAACRRAAERRRGLPVLAQGVCWRARVPTTAPGSRTARENATRDVAFPFCAQGRRPELRISRLPSRPKRGLLSTPLSGRLKFPADRRGFHYGRTRHPSQSSASNPRRCSSRQHRAAS